MSKNINDDVLLSCSTLNLNTGICYCFVVDRDYKAYRASFNTNVEGDVKRTETVQLYEDEKLVVDDFLEDFIRHDTPKDFDYDVLFELAGRYNDTVKISENNHEQEVKTYTLIDSLAFNHQELSSDNLHQLSDVKKQVMTGNTDRMDSGYIFPDGQALKKSMK